jgi:hypothetical protein
VIRTQISLTDDQMADLRAEARRRHVSIAAIIREAVNERAARAGLGDARMRAALAAGRYGSGLPDAGLRHDDYLGDMGR